MWSGSTCPHMMASSRVPVRRSMITYTRPTFKPAMIRTTMIVTQIIMPLNTNTLYYVPDLIEYNTPKPKAQMNTSIRISMAK